MDNDVDWAFTTLLGSNMTQFAGHMDQSSPSLPNTPHTVDDDELSQGITEAQLTQEKKKKGNFTIDEDMALISSWLNTSMNPRKGTNQKSVSFWAEITKKFWDITKIERTSRSLNCRFTDIQKAVNKFIGVVTQLENSANCSGYNELDKIQKAKSMYLKLHKEAFKFEHCWNMLRNQPKWKETEGVAGRKKQTGRVIGSNDSPTTPSPVDLDKEGNFIDLERPPGTKVAIANEKPKKRKHEDDNPLGSIISDWKVQKQKMHEDKMKIEQEKMAMAKRDEELRIMTMDLNNLDDVQKEYIMILRANIMEKSRNKV